MLTPPDDDFGEMDSMKFRLTYTGPLQSSQGEPRVGQKVPMAGHKHDIRRKFHKQLERLWETNKFLRESAAFATDYGLPMKLYNQREPLKEIIAQLYCRNGYRFVPLVREGWFLQCSLDILFLRCDPPGSLLTGGDLDNRVKTLIDALRLPMSLQELGGNTPQSDEDPFFCLLEDDKQVTSLRVETDTLLGGENFDPKHVHLVVNVEITPYHGTTFNSMF
jgi:hypothetical protein